MLRLLPRSVSAILSLLLAAVALRADYAVGESHVPSPLIRSAADFAVYGNHPRLFFRDTDLPTIRARVAGEYRAEWDQMRAALEQKVLSQPPGNLAQKPHLKNWQQARNVAFVAAITGEKKYVAWAVQWARELAAAEPAKDDDDLRGRLQCLAVAYDWLYPHFSDTEKKQIQQSILAHLDKTWRFVSRQANYVSGHSRWGNFANAIGLLALATERPELREKLLAVREHWVNGYFPTQAWIASEGGYHMGWTYSAAYTTGNIYCLWSTATNECAFFPWQAKLPLFWIYGRRGDGFYPNTGDAYTASGDLTSLRLMLVIASGVLKDRHARWLLPRTEDGFDEILYGDKRVQPLAPDDASTPLPLARSFGPAGVVLARDRWDAGTTLLQFRSVPFYSANHHHRDENSFTIDYRGPLAIDSGLYDENGVEPGGYSGPHWLNYFTRTIAHNAITVYDPAQRMEYQGKAITNDGGQPFRVEEPAKLAELQPGGPFHLDGITSYQDAADYTAMSGDASKAYDPARVKLAQRSLVYLRHSTRAHPIVVVFDRVESAKPEFEKRFLLHTVNEPVVHEGLAVTQNEGGRLSCLTLLPADAKLTLVGGPGKEAWVDGANHSWSKVRPVRPGLTPGAWRLEVSPGAPRQMDYFLHVLFVDDADAAPVKRDAATLHQSTDRAEVQVAGWSVSFPFAAGGTPKVERVP